MELLHNFIQNLDGTTVILPELLGNSLKNCKNLSITDFTPIKYNIAGYF